MNKQKHTPSTNLQKSSVIFMQLGLVLALFVVYLTLEHESFYKIPKLAISEPIDDEPKIDIPSEIIFEKKVVKKTPKKVAPKAAPIQKPSSEFKVVPDKTEIKIEDVIPPTTDIDEDTPIQPDANNIEEVDPVEKTTEILPFHIIEIAPAFPSCKDLATETQKKVCFNEKMRKHINRKFDTDLAQDLGLSPGKKRINVQFVIDEVGNITDIRVKAPHKRLEKEAKRVVKLLPQMIPATQRLKHVKVRYNLPILFNVEDY